MQISGYTSVHLQRRKRFFTFEAPESFFCLFIIGGYGVELLTGRQSVFEEVGMEQARVHMALM